MPIPNHVSQIYRIEYISNRMSFAVALCDGHPPKDQRFNDSLILFVHSIEEFREWYNQGVSFAERVTRDGELIYDRDHDGKLSIDVADPLRRAITSCKVYQLLIERQSLSIEATQADFMTTLRFLIRSELGIEIYQPSLQLLYNYTHFALPDLPKSLFDDTIPFYERVNLLSAIVKDRHLVFASIAALPDSILV